MEQTKPDLGPAVEGKKPEAATPEEQPDRPQVGLPPLYRGEPFVLVKFVPGALGAMVPQVMMPEEMPAVLLSGAAAYLDEHARQLYRLGMARAAQAQAEAQAAESRIAVARRPSLVVPGK